MNLITSLICEELKLNYEKKENTVKLKCSSTSLYIDQTLLCAISLVFREILCDSPNLEYEFSLHDYDIETVQALVKLSYFGEVDDIIDETIIKDISTLSKALGISFNLEKVFVEQSEENSIEKDSIEFLEQEDHISNSIEIPVVAQEQTLKQNELTYHCTVEGCTFHFFTHAALKKHVENVHQALAFVCHYCQKRYKHQSTLKEHLNTHKEHKGFLCDICGRGFKTKDLCTSHRLSHGDRKLTCSECGAKFKQRNVLHQHKTVKHGLKKFECKTCGKEFATKQNRDTHNRIHSGEAPYDCEVCQVKFKRLHHFKKHLTALPHIDKVSEFKSKGGVPPVHLDPSFVLGQDANELAKQSCCDICHKSPNQPVTKFKSTYHFFKHIRSKGHFERIVQLIKNGQSIASHLVPPNLHIDERNAPTSDVFFLETV